MPKFLLSYLESKPLFFHLCVALMGGLILRLLTAYFSYGPMAIDDWAHGLSPAYQLFQGTPVDLPPYRSPLLPWLLSLFFHFSAVFGITENRIHQIQFISGCLGIISLLAVVGTYFYVRHQPQKTAGAFALYLLSFCFAMPFIGIRAFGEAVSAGLLLMGLGLCEHAHFKSSTLKLALGLTFMGISVLFRYQVGLIFLTYGLVLCLRKKVVPLLIYIGISTLTLGSEIGINMLFHRTPLETLFTYFAVNQGGAAQLGIQPWYTHILFLSVLTLFPLSLTFITQLKSLFREHAVLVWSILVFVIAHSFILHKEERFMFPVVPLVLLALTYVWQRERLNGFVKYIYTPIFIGFNILGLAIVLTSNPLENVIDPLRKIQTKFETAVVLDLSHYSAMPFLYMITWKPITFSRIEDIDQESFSAAKVFRRHSPLPVAWISTDRKHWKFLESLSEKQFSDYSCSLPEKSGNWIDQQLYRLQPKVHYRRQSTYHVFCEQKTKTK